VTLFVLEEFWVFVLNCEGNFVGGILNGTFLRFWSVVHVGSLRRGTIGVHFGNLLVTLLCVNGVTYLSKDVRGTRV
jgi:hypothetical protein